MQLISMWFFALDQIYAYNSLHTWKLENTDIHIWTNTTSKNLILIRLKKIKNAIANFCSQYSLFMSQIKYFDVFEW